MTRIAVVGDSILDRDVLGDVHRVCPDAPVPVVDVTSENARPGGAALAAALLADRGVEVQLITALAGDEAGDVLRALLQHRNVSLIDCGSNGTTLEKVRVRVNGQSLLRLDRGAATAQGSLPAIGVRAIICGDAVLVADYGRGMSADATVRYALTQYATRGVLVWDPHPRGAVPVDGARLVTPNDREAMHFTGTSGTRLTEVAARARTLLSEWKADAVAITRGSDGALLARTGGAHVAVPAKRVTGGDACGAGDCFSGVAAHALASGAIITEAVEAAVDVASAFVAAGGAAGNEPAVDDHGKPRRNVTADAVRAAGGTIVATGGCFDLLHAGHVAMLQAARRLGDHLVVLLNSDTSVRRLKGPDRPIQRQADRRRVLAALGCVDEVIVFDDDTPIPALQRLRPDVFVKGGDYTVESLPEAAAIAGWGGQAVVVPYLDGRSTTRIFQEVGKRVRD
jgi:rfaE bifunctional protein nucleotidyltransferase chain/domain/rfaE bifunctional protein kinase chain/domain